MGKLDCRGEICPLPVIKTKKTLDTMKAGDTVAVWVDNTEAVENIIKMLTSRGYPYTVEEHNADYILTVTKGEGSISNKAAQDVSSLPEATESIETLVNAVVVIASDQMGEGNEELGRALLKTFIYTLTELEHAPKTLIFYNAGVRMTTEGSAVLEHLQKLSQAGTDILSCGACLQYYGLTDVLKAGRISNMYEIAGLMLENRVVKP